MYLLDTNVISETFKQRPNERVIAWLRSQPSTMHFTSTISLGEIAKGAALVQDVQRKNHIMTWLHHDLVEWFSGRILTFDMQTALCWGKVSAECVRTLPTADSMLIATALTHNLTLVTRNTKDFNFPSLQLLNPWEIV